MGTKESKMKLKTLTRTRTMKIARTILVWIIAGAPAWVGAQEASLEDYVREGLENNLALKQKEVNYRKSLEVLKQARSMFYPDISINMRYTAAQGGRIIDFPVGTMLNPVYQSLNFLLGQDKFQDISNMEFAFYRPTEHESKVSLLQPIVDTKIYYNSRIRNELSAAAKADAEAYQRQLVAEIKTAYFSYLKTLRLIQLLDDTRKLLEENIRVNEKLFENNKVTVDNVHRSRAELSKLEQQAAVARKNRQVAAAYFNFLLNRPFETPIGQNASYDSVPGVPPLDILTSHALDAREELDMLRYYSRAADDYLSMNRMDHIPNLYAAVDYGFQGRHYEFNSKQDYVLASLVLRWDLFHGFEKRARISEARIEQDLRATQMEETENKIRLQAVEAYYDWLAAAESVNAAGDELRSARDAFRVVRRKFGEGQASLVEFIDARTGMTRAEERLIISKYDYHIRYAELEKTACLYPLEGQ
jgi:outer membrane protein